MKCRIQALREKLQEYREQLLDVTNVRDYDLVRLRIAFIKDQLLKHYGVSDP